MKVGVPRSRRTMLHPRDSRPPYRIPTIAFFMGLVAVTSPIVEAGRPVQRPTVSLLSVCGNSNSGLVRVNATGPGSAIEVNSGMGLTNSFNCIVHFVSTSNTTRMAYSIHKLDIPHSCKSYVKVWGGNEDVAQVRKLCEELEDPSGRTKARVIDHNSLYVKMHTDRDDWKYGEYRVGFKLTITVLRPSVPIGDNQRRCLRDEYPCRGEDYCIHQKFVCDGFNNCGDASDEMCLSSVIALAAVITGAILITVLIGVFICYIRRKRRNKPYDTSRATSTQSVQSDASLFGTVRDCYYRPLYPIGEGLKIKLDELPKDPDEPLLPPHYLVSKNAPHEHLPTRLLLAASASLQKENSSGTQSPLKNSRSTASTEVDKNASVEVTGVRPKTGVVRRGSFPPTKKGRKALANTGADFRLRLVLENSLVESPEEHEDTLDAIVRKHQSASKHMVLLPQ